MRKFKTLRDVPAPLAGAMPRLSLDGYNAIAAIAEGVGEMPQSYAALEAGEELWGVVYDFPRLVEAILFSEQTAAEKTAALEALTGEFLARVKKPLAVVAAEPEADPPAPEPDAAPVAELAAPVQVVLHESAVWPSLDFYLGLPLPVALAESLQADGPLLLDVEVIQPGWGNTKDNFYYSPEVLRTYAPRLVGAKMYETDHKPGEKSNGTWVSTVRTIKGFSARGAPIAEVLVHSPDFAKRARNLAEGKLLERLECSIQAPGRARAGFTEGGRTGRRVEEIGDASQPDSINVDWVTRAGAGGHATQLAEADTQPAPVTPPVVAPTPPVPQRLAAADVARILAATRLPAASRARLAEAHYTAGADVEAAAAAEVAYLKAVTGSGQPFGMGQHAPVTVPASDPAARDAKLAEAGDSVIKKYFG